MRPVRFLVLLISLAIAPAVRAEPAVAAKELLNALTTAWNKGDLNGVMDGYWNSPELTFFAADEIRKGWQETYKYYQRDGRDMGQLTFDEVSFDPLSDDTVLVRGRWKLMLKDGNPGGLFTLIVAKKPEGWRIVHDHTSVEPAKQR